MKKLLALLLVLVIIPVVFAGVTNPLPAELNLLKGEEGRFKFQIQNLNKPEDIECNLELEGTSDLEISFDDNPIAIAGNSKSDFYGTVKAPKSLGNYAQTFCVKCNPVDKASGASVQVDSCGLPIAVNVVEQRQKDNMTVEYEESNLLPIIILIIVIIVGLIVYFMLKNMKRPKKFVKRTTKKTVKKTTKKKATKKTVKKKKTTKRKKR